MPLWQRPNHLRRRAEWLASQTYVLLAIQVPKDNQKTPQSAEQFFASLHGIYRDDPAVQEHVSFEIVAQKDSIVFYVLTPIHLRDFIEGQLYAQYPDLQIRQVEDYTSQINLEGKHVAATKIQLTKEDVYPIKTFADADLDPLAGITAVLSGLQEGEHVWLQVVIRPIGDEWQQKGVDYVQALRSGKSARGAGLNIAAVVFRGLSRLVREVISPGSGVGEAASSAEPPKLSAPQEAALKAIEGKVTKLGFETIFRLLAIAPDPATARAKVQATLAAYKQFNTTNLNGFTSGEVRIDDYPFWEMYLAREFEEKGNILNIEELASVYHFPSQAVETSAINWAGSKKGEAPFNLPLKELVPPDILTVLGKTDFRNTQKEFGIKLDDRRRHIYVIGKSGTGKSTLLENMAIDDVREGRGVIIVDPHGEFADKVIDAVPEHRIEDVVVMDPSDHSHPVAFNLLETVGDNYKGMVASGFVGIFKKIFGNSWGPRLEYILRNTVLALLDSENATMLGVPRMLTDPGFRSTVVAQVKDAVIRDFWVNEFAAMDAKQRTEAVAPILNKVGQFLSTSTIRNIVGQPKSTIDIRKIMDERKILVVNLCKGKIGEDNMALLGAMIITKVQLAAMSRADVPPEQRPDCFLYVDEFQNFATESFATILSEARKYNLGLTIAHQYIAQMSEEVKDAVIGNVGTIITFRIGGPDAEVLVKEFAPVFEVNDLINLQKGHVYMKLLIDGIAAPAFSAQTFMPVHVEASYRDRVITFSRERYSHPRDEVEDMIEETAGYKKKREAEEAAKQAEAILRQGTQSIGIGSSGSVGQGVVTGSGGVLPSAPAPPVATAPRQAPISPLGSESQPVGPNAPRPHVTVTESVTVTQELHPTQEPVHTESVQKPNTNIVDSVPEPSQTAEIPGPSEHDELIEATLNDGESNQANDVETGRERPLREMDGWVYREVSQRGGMRWYLGERKEAHVRRLEAKASAEAQAPLGSETGRGEGMLPPSEPVQPTAGADRASEMTTSTLHTETAHEGAQGQVDAPAAIYVQPFTMPDESPVAASLPTVQTPNTDSSISPVEEERSGAREKKDDEYVLEEGKTLSL